MFQTGSRGIHKVPRAYHDPRSYGEYLMEMAKEVMCRDGRVDPAIFVVKTISVLIFDLKSWLPEDRTDWQIAVAEIIRHSLLDVGVQALAMVDEVGTVMGSTDQGKRVVSFESASMNRGVVGDAIYVHVEWRDQPRVARLWHFEREGGVVRLGMEYDKELETTVPNFFETARKNFGGPGVYRGDTPEV